MFFSKSARLLRQQSLACMMFKVLCVSTNANDTGHREKDMPSKHCGAKTLLIQAVPGGGGRDIQEGTLRATVGQHCGARPHLLCRRQHSSAAACHEQWGCQRLAGANLSLCSNKCCSAGMGGRLGIGFCSSNTLCLLHPKCFSLAWW